MKYGYIRISHEYDNSEEQIQALRTHGINQIKTDISRTPKSYRKELNNLINEIAPGDHIVIKQLSNIARGIKDLVSILDMLENKGIFLLSIDDEIDTATESGVMLRKVLNAILKFDRKMIEFWIPDTKPQT